MENTHGIELGWLIDPEHRIMIEYTKCLTLALVVVVYTHPQTIHGVIFHVEKLCMGLMRKLFNWISF